MTIYLKEATWFYQKTLGDKKLTKLYDHIY